MAERRPGSQPVTIKDVAARAQVALSSVSRAMSGHPDVSESMRLRVEAAARELGYEPDLIAQGLRGGSTKTVGFALRDISNPLFAVVAKSAEQVLRRAGYSVLLTNSDGDIETEAANLAVLRRRRIDGLIISLVSETAERTRRALQNLDVPIVLVDRELEGLDSSQLLCDHYGGVRAAVAELLRLGHTRIVMITGGLDVRSSRERRRGYVDAFAEAGVEVDEEFLFFGDFDNTYATSTVLELLDRPAPPTAIIAGGLPTTAGALKALQSRSLVPGRDLAVVALDDWPMLNVFGSSVAVVTRDPVKIGAHAANLLLEVLRTGRTRTLEVPTQFDANDALRPPPARLASAAGHGPHGSRNAPA
jgi:LacI family transcriptional regulator